MSRAIEVEGLVRDFAGARALDGVNLNVPTGQVLGLLGPNGAGWPRPIRAGCADGWTWRRAWSRCGATAGRLATSIAHLLGMILLVLVFAVAFSWVMVLVGVMARDPEHVQLFGFTALFPVTFVNSVFVPVETMPEWLQGFVYANPVSLLADAARALMNGGPAAAPALGSLFWALGIALVFAPLSVYALNRRLARG